MTHHETDELANDPPPPESKERPHVKGKSGEHQAVRAYAATVARIESETLGRLRRFNAWIDRRAHELASAADRDSRRSLP